MNCQNNCFKNNINKFILEKSKCIDNCNNDDEYRYEYNNICYKSCPKRTNNITNNEFLCEDLLCEEKNNYYYNYNQNKCISNIDGFYVNDTIEKTIDKCDIQCQKCENKSNLCISCNKEKNYYQILNERLNNDNFVNFYNETPYGYILDQYFYKPCYFTCQNCFGYGNENDNKCSQCKNGFYFNVYENNSNCYKACDFLYNFNELNLYNCTLTEKCPDKFNKLIRNKGKCIDDCSKDNKFKYEFNNECFEDCPYNTIYSYNNKYLCINQNGKICPSIEFFLGKCKIDNSNNDIDDQINEIREAIKEGKLDPIIEDIIKGNNTDLTIEYDNNTFQITSPKIQNGKKYDNVSIIKLGECENLLRQNNNLEDNDLLLIFKIEVQKEDSLIPCVEYEIYNYNNKLN